MFLEQFVASLNQPNLEDLLVELRQLETLCTSDVPEEFMDKEIRMRKYSRLEKRDVVAILEKSFGFFFIMPTKKNETDGCVVQDERAERARDTGRCVHPDARDADLVDGRGVAEAAAEIRAGKSETEKPGANDQNAPRRNGARKTVFTWPRLMK